MYSRNCFTGATYSRSVMFWLISFMLQIIKSSLLNSDFKELNGDSGGV